MKNYPVGTKLILVNPRDLKSHFDVMAKQGKHDDEKNEGFQHALQQGKVIQDPGSFRFTPVEQNGEPRLALELPYAWVYPPTVANIPSLGDGLEIEDGRSFVAFARSSRIKHIVVALTPHTSEVEALKEASRGNLPEGGIRRSQQDKQDIRKTVHRAFHILRMTRSEITAMYGPIYEGQKLAFIQVVAEVWSEHNRQCINAGVVQFRDGEGTIEEIAKARGVTVVALSKAIADTQRARTRREAFSKTCLRFVKPHLIKATTNVINMKPSLERKIEAQVMDYEEAQAGLGQLQKGVEKLLGHVKDLRESIKNDYAKGRGAAVGR